VEDAFRNIDIHPSDYHLLGFTWNGFYYYDKSLPMGASSSCQIFENYSCALQWIMETKYQVAGMSHILDDFLFVGPPKSDKCQQDLDKFLTLCSILEVPIKAEKNCSTYYCYHHIRYRGRFLQYGMPTTTRTNWQS
jgi:hypothetical protein